MSHPLPPAAFNQQLATHLAQRVLDELQRIQAPPNVTRLVLSLSYFVDPKPAAADLPFFLREATSAMLETGGLP